MKGNKGITLIALIITVIVLLILAGTAVSISINGGNIFDKATEAKSSWNDAVAREEIELNNVLDILDEQVTGIAKVKDTTPGTLAGSGEASDPYKIESIEDLVAFAYNVNSGTIYSGKTVALTQSLDFQSDKSYVNPNASYEKDTYGYKVATTGGTALKTLMTDTTGTGFEPIGNGNAQTTGFAGTFDGKNNAICNLFQNITSNHCGLFGRSKNNIIVKNLKNNSYNISSSSSSALVGGIIGELFITEANSIISNCSVSGIIDTLGLSGGIVGCTYNTDGDIKIINCNSATNIVETTGVAGGIVGCANNCITIINCYNTNNISGDYPSGGIAGACGKGGTIINCYNIGDIISSQSNAGGILGTSGSADNISNMTITNCYNIGNIRSSSCGGGILGNQNYGTGTITNCYNTGNVTGGVPTGGIVGHKGTIGNCHNTGNVTGNMEQYARRNLW